MEFLENFNVCTTVPNFHAQLRRAKKGSPTMSDDDDAAEPNGTFLSGMDTTNNSI
jgi:hypothetical protein